MIPHGTIPPQNLPLFGVLGVHGALSAAAGNPVGILLQALARWFLAHSEPHLQLQVGLIPYIRIIVNNSVQKLHMGNAAFPFAELLR